MYSDLSDICKLAEKVKSRSIMSLFSEQPERAEKLSVSVGDIFLDYSKQNITSDELSALSKWADNNNLSEAIQKMFSGSKINNTEDRA
ncbi:MAG: glucose-6-phosphate isomerase, partial [Colwelliaceae bacterium]|nr:glucose-6-phosphate isomerase [Colwelliaceae bacterium]